MRKTNSLERIQEIIKLENIINDSSIMSYEYEKLCAIWKLDSPEDRNYLLEWILVDGIDYVYMKVVEELMLTEDEYKLLHEDHLTMKEIYYLQKFNLDIYDRKALKRIHLSMLEYALIKRLRDIEFPRKALLMETFMDMTEKLFKK